jgi:hypothetical protein
MTRIERICADFNPLLSFGFIRVNPFKSDLIRVPLPLTSPVWFRLCQFSCMLPGLPINSFDFDPAG